MIKERIKYVNHLSEEIIFGENGIYTNESDIRNYEWDKFDEYNSTFFFKKKAEKNLPVQILVDTEAEAVKKKNMISEIFEKDIGASKQGKLYIGEYYLSCNIVKSQKKRYLLSKKYLELDLTIFSPKWVWIKETLISFKRDGTVLSDTDNKVQKIRSVKNLDGFTDFNYDFTSEHIDKTVNNFAVSGANFKIAIFGKVKNPQIKIQGHIYEIYDTLEEGEIIIIDSKNKTIIKYTEDGTQNIFNKRRKDFYIFEKIKHGFNKISWDGSFGFDITIYEERSEPEWI